MVKANIHAAIEAARLIAGLPEDLAQDALVIAHPHCLNKI
jgi:hypothetical protein